VVEGKANGLNFIVIKIYSDVFCYLILTRFHLTSLFENRKQKALKELNCLKNQQLSEFLKKRQKTRRLLPDYPFKSNFVQIEGINIHYVDEGCFDDHALLFLHGVPTWSFTFRKIIPECVTASNRVIAPDLPGFGKSDKNGLSKNLSLENLVIWMEEFIWRLGLKKIFLFAHDWGAIIGLMLAAKNPEHFSGIIACNGMLPVIGQNVPTVFQLWKYFCRYSPVLPVGQIIGLACERKLSRAEKYGYDFPFLKSGKKTAVRLLPGLIPLKYSDPGAELIMESWEILEKWEKPFLTVFSNNDPITKNGEKTLQERIPGTKNQPHRIVSGKHFLQEDAPDELSRIIIEFVKSNQ
jgi:haloalkane dehalogenase